jgi:hypothetical protein
LSHCPSSEPSLAAAQVQFSEAELAEHTLAIVAINATSCVKVAFCSKTARRKGCRNSPFREKKIVNAMLPPQRDGDQSWSSWYSVDERLMWNRR